jgi:hypothetical protein
MICPKCGSNNVNVQVAHEIKRRGCLTVLFYIVLLLIPLFGWIALALLLRGRKSKTVTWRVCQDCGCKGKVK